MAMVESYEIDQTAVHWDHPGHAARLRARLCDGTIISRDISGMSPIQVWDILRELEAVEV